MKRLCSVLLLSSLYALGGCTLVVWSDASAPAGCDGDDDCPAGEVCADDGCEAIATDAIGRQGTLIDVEGGVVTGPDGVVLTIPAGAVAVATAFVIKKTTSTLPRDNFETDDAFYVVEPARSFAIGATVRLPGDGADAFLRPDRDDVLAWELLERRDGDFELLRTGVIVRGTGTP